MKYQEVLEVLRRLEGVDRVVQESQQALRVAVETVRDAKGRYEVAKAEKVTVTKEYEGAVKELLESPDGMRKLLEGFLGRGPQQATVEVAVQPSPPVRKRPRTYAEAIQQYFPKAPKVVTVQEVLDILEGQGFKFSASYQTSPRQLVSAWLWRNTSAFKKVGPATYRRIR